MLDETPLTLLLVDCLLAWRQQQQREETCLGPRLFQQNFWVEIESRVSVIPNATPLSSCGCLACAVTFCGAPSSRRDLFLFTKSHRLDCLHRLLVSICFALLSFPNTMSHDLILKRPKANEMQYASKQAVGKSSCRVIVLHHPRSGCVVHCIFACNVVGS